jgi:hypothetical protein
MRTLITLLFFLVSAAVSSANTVSIGGTAIEISNPPSSATVTPQMATLYDLQKKFVPPNNEEFLAFIPEKEVPAVLRDEIPKLARRFSVQTSKELVNASFSRSDFLELKTSLKAQNDDLMKKIERDLPDFMGSINKEISNQYNVNLALSVSQIVPLPVHEETDRTIAFSCFGKYNANDESGNPVPYVAVFTATLIHVKGKVLFLYSYAEETGLEWSRQISKQWADAVVAANPSDLQSSLKESLPSPVTGTDWGKVGARAVLGAFIGLIIGLIGWAINRSKTRQQNAE